MQYFILLSILAGTPFDQRHANLRSEHPLVLYLPETNSATTHLPGLQSKSYQLTGTTRNSQYFHLQYSVTGAHTADVPDRRRCTSSVHQNLHTHILLRIPVDSCLDVVQRCSRVECSCRSDSLTGRRICFLTCLWLLWLLSLKVSVVLRRVVLVCMLCAKVVFDL